MIHVPVRFVTESLGIAPQTAAREPQRRPISRYADRGRASRSLRGLETRGTAGCCIRSKSSRFQAHPFREGNGRASKIYMQHVAELSPFRLDFSGIDPMLWNLSSELSRPSLLRQTVDARFLYHVFATATRPATQAPPAAPQQGVGPRSASYPRAATAAPQQPQLNKPAGYTPRQSHRGQGRAR